MVSEGYYIDRLFELNSYEREGKSMQDELFTAKAGCLTLYRCQWWVRLSQQLDSMLKSIYKAISQRPVPFHTTQPLLQALWQLPC